jgi:hypothetical protein
MPLVIARRPGESLVATYPDGTVVFLEVALNEQLPGVVSLIVRAPVGSIVDPPGEPLVPVTSCTSYTLIYAPIVVRRTAGELVKVTPPGNTPVHFKVLKIAGRGARLVTMCDREVHIDRINREGKNERKTSTQPRS